MFVLVARLSSRIVWFTGWLVASRKIGGTSYSLLPTSACVGTQKPLATFKVCECIGVIPYSLKDGAYFND